MAKKVIVVRIGTNEVQIVHMEHTANYPTVYGCVRFPTPENAVKDGMIMMKQDGVWKKLQKMGS